jgi:hypothetical protein
MTRVVPEVEARAPDSPALTGYDQAHLVTYLRLLDAEAEDADWREVARVVLGLGPEHDEGAARETYCSHLQRAHWMTQSGYRHLLRGGAPH